MTKDVSPFNTALCVVIKHDEFIFELVKSNIIFIISPIIKSKENE